MAGSQRSKSSEMLQFVESPWYQSLHYKVAPPLLLVLFPLMTRVLIVLGNPELSLEWKKFPDRLSSIFAWKVVLSAFFWAYLSLMVPGKKFFGPPTPFGGYRPCYSANGTHYYLTSLVAFGFVDFKHPDLCIKIYQNFGSIVDVLNLCSMLLCIFLLVKAATFPEEPKDLERFDKYPLPYLFHTGRELHPRLLGVDVKQWTNCRVGMMGWAMLVLVFCLAGIRMNGLTASYGAICNAFLINLYLFKFFYWETGYFNTLDITLDRAGYYICWGCMCWVQVFYTFSAYHMVAHPSSIGPYGAVTIVIFGVTWTSLNYLTDRQKEAFRRDEKSCTVWGRPAKYIVVEYKDHEGNTNKSKLLVDGLWGVSRHLNYVFEILLALSWSLPAAEHGILPFAYSIFLTVLLLHRIFRDEKKCSAKYGTGWETYCKKVPYRMIPLIF